MTSFTLIFYTTFVLMLLLAKLILWARIIFWHKNMHGRGQGWNKTFFRTLFFRRHFLLDEKTFRKLTQSSVTFISGASGNFGAKIQVVVTLTDFWTMTSKYGGKIQTAIKMKIWQILAGKFELYFCIWILAPKIIIMKVVQDWWTEADI